MEDKKAPSIDMSKLQASITRIEFTNKMNDFRMQMRELSDTIFSVKKVNESLYIRVEELEKEVEKLKKFSKKNKEE
jgi:hypothetical protein